jgi:hypothetical protein
MRNVTPLLAFVCLLASCTAEVREDGLDPDRVLHMAGEEAGGIANPTARLTRQLNVAFRQIQHMRLADARSTLGRARGTLEGVHDASVHDQPPLSDHDRLAGWVSVSELSREAEDKAVADVALGRALGHLENMQPEQARCEYVPGIAREVRKLRGDKAAAGLLVRAGEWAAKIPELPTRRAAYLVFATELFRANDYEAARLMVRRDGDATWRADALTAVSDFGRFAPVPAARGILGRASETASFFDPSEPMKSGPTTQPGDKPFGKAVDFRSTFYRGN